MKTIRLSEELLKAFEIHLVKAEYAPGSREKYMRDARRFAQWLSSRPLDKIAAAQWKALLLTQNYAPVTINSMLVAVNCLFKFLGRDDCRVKELRLQRQIFRGGERELARDEYVRLLDTARALGRERLALTMETICATGIRVSGVKYITVEAVRRERAEITLKGKIRTILLPGKLCRPPGSIWSPPVRTTPAK